MEYDCPNCGEPIDESAASCPNCGSDDETGWNPEVDYYSVELPEDDCDPEDRDPEDRDPEEYVVAAPGKRRARDWQGRLALLLAIATLAWAGHRAYAWNTILPLLFLGGCFLFYTAGTKKSVG